ncbi:hypothetical protein [Ruficoccus sp. ZRK36]|uniref:hypothetical protein n=1 Tax=Ruficoccus sp. ZRK36 TaxID=2866311 RepID=UPI001C73C29D|nr:hypothetical protein [Ruficoccus sp. ZRK36]QYY35299.1 hypothetical protein K0V07_13485 [Ruficoccus sp. ZRK36]
MVIRSDFLNHYKTRILRRKLGAEGVLALLNLWAHCEARQAWHFKNTPPEIFAAICDYAEDPVELHETMKELKWIEVIDQEVRVHQWDQYNRQLIQRWTNGNKRKGLIVTPYGLQEDPNADDGEGDEDATEGRPPSDRPTPAKGDRQATAEPPPDDLACDEVRCDEVRCDEVSKDKPISARGSAGRHAKGQSPFQVRLKAVFGHQPATWPDAVDRAWKKLAKSRPDHPHVVTQEEVELVEAWYAKKDTPPVGQFYWTRSSLSTLLNNFDEDVATIRKNLKKDTPLSAAEPGLNMREGFGL